MHITRVEINNILSIESATLDVSSSGLTLIDGWNFDDDRANGAGKTAICNAIAFALYDAVPRKITKSEILRWGAKQGYAKVTLESHGRVYEVTRTRPAGVVYAIDGVSKDITQEEFEKEIGINYNQFITSMYNAQGQEDNFLFLNDRAKKDFLLNLMDLSVLNGCYKHTKDLIKNEQTQINEEKIKLQGYLSKIQAYSESLVDEVEIKNNVRNTEKEVEEFETQMKQLSSVPKPDLSSFDTLQQKIDDKRKKFTDIRQQIAVLRSEYRNVETQIVQADSRRDDAHASTECPACSEALTVTGNSVSLASDTEARRKHTEHVIAGLREQLVPISTSINSLEAEVLKESELNKLQSDIKAKRQKQYSEYDSAQKRISDLKRLVEQKRGLLNSFQQSLENNKSLNDKIVALKNNAKEIQKTIKTSMDNIELLESAAQIFSPTGAPAYIMDSAVDSFNSVVTQYVQMIWPSASYELQTYKEKKDGSKTAKFSELLMINGKKCSIGSLSGGQQRALSLALDFAIRDVMDLHFGIHMNPVILDEPFDGLDSIGREIVIDLLEELSAKRNIWVIDHASEAKAMFNDVIRVEKRSGVTSVIS